MFRSKAQSRFLHANPHILGKEALDEWESKTDYSAIPERVEKSKRDDSGVTSVTTKEATDTPDVTSKPGVKKYSPASSLHRLVSQLIK